MKTMASASAPTAYSKDSVMFLVEPPKTKR